MNNGHPTIKPLLNGKLYIWFRNRLSKSRIYGGAVVAAKNIAPF
jgi:hypothetical protein